MMAARWPHDGRTRLTPFHETEQVAGEITRQVEPEGILDPSA